MLSNFTTTDFAKRLYLGFPRGWVPEPTWDDAPDVAVGEQVSPNLKAVLMALAAAWKESDAGITGNYDILQYVERQTRINTASDFWLDLIALDFTGGQLTRHLNETDDSFRRRLQIDILRPKGTRCALECGITNLTGYTPTIIEPMNAGDCGGYAAVIPDVNFVLPGSVSNTPTIPLSSTAGLQVGMTIGGQDAPTDRVVVITAIKGNTLTVAPYLTAPAGRLLTAYNPIAPVAYSKAGAYGSINNNTELFVSQTLTASTTIYVTDDEEVEVGMLISGGLLPAPVQITAMPNPNTLVVNTPVTLPIGAVLTAYKPANFGAAYQMFVEVTRPDGQGIPNVAGYSTAFSGYSTLGGDPLGYYGNNRYPPNYGYGQYCGLSEVQGNVTDADIYKCVADTVPAGVTAWTRISSQLPPVNLYVGGLIGLNTYFGYTCFSEPDIEPGAASGMVIIKPMVHGTLSISELHGSAIAVFRPSGTLAAQSSLAAFVQLSFTVSAAFGVQAGLKATVVFGFTLNSTLIMGNQGVTYLNGTPPFVIGKSVLTPPGGLLGQTFILGYSKLGNNQYGY